MRVFLVVWLAGCNRSGTGTALDDGTWVPDTDPLPDTDTDAQTDTGSDSAGTAETADTGETCTCDDGLDCSTEACDPLGRCLVTPVSVCAWPAVAPEDATSLAGADPGLEENQSGATWNPVTRELWVVRNAGPSGIWRLVEDGPGSWVVDTDPDGEPAVWTDVGDAESLVLVDPIGAPTLLHVLDEGEASIVAFDLTVAEEEPEPLRTWDLSSWLPDADPFGAEGLAFVQDDLLAAWDFVDGDGVPRASTLGMGGLMFVAHQNGGQVWVFDLAPESDAVVHVATFDTARSETSGLELDPSTGRLYLWHGENDNDLEVTRLSSTDRGGRLRKLDTEYVFDHPGEGNLEGVALMGTGDCADGGRPLFLIEDDGGERSIELYPDWPIGCPAR